MTLLGPSVPPGPGDHLGDALSGLLDGELPARVEASARSHLAACPDCAEELRLVGAARSWVRALPEVEPPFGFYERILRDDAEVAGWRLAWNRRRVGVAALAASAAAAVALLGLSPPRETPVTPQVSPLVETHAANASFGSDPLSRLAPIGVPVTFRR